MKINLILALKYALFLGLILIVWQISSALLWQMNYDFDNLEFKKTEIKGVVKDFILSKKQNRKAIIIEHFDKKKQVLDYKGCNFVVLRYYSNIGDSVFKERDTFRIRLKNSIRDTIVNDDL
jgi:hypothetical protein